LPCNHKVFIAHKNIFLSKLSAARLTCYPSSLAKKMAAPVDSLQVLSRKNLHKASQAIKSGYPPEIYCML